MNSCKLLFLYSHTRGVHPMGFNEAQCFAEFFFEGDKNPGSTNK